MPFHPDDVKDLDEVRAQRAKTAQRSIAKHPFKIGDKVRIADSHPLVPMMVEPLGIVTGYLPEGTGRVMVMTSQPSGLEWEVQVEGSALTKENYDG